MSHLQRPFLCRLDHDFDRATRPREKVHQSLHGDLAKSPCKNSGHVGLAVARQLSDPLLREAFSDRFSRLPRAPRFGRQPKNGATNGGFATVRWPDCGFATFSRYSVRSGEAAHQSEGNVRPLNEDPFWRNRRRHRATANCCPLP